LSLDLSTGRSRPKRFERPDVLDPTSGLVDAPSTPSPGETPSAASSRPPRAQRLLTWITRPFVWTARLLSAPFRGYLSLRRSMTFASVTALLTLVMTLNVIWGFPWSGMFGACTALLLGGWAMNRLMRPKLSTGIALPRSAIAGEPFAVSVRLINRRRIPALDLRLGWHREGMRDIYKRSRGESWQASGPLSVPSIRSGGEVRWHGAMRFDCRGIHTVPPFQVASTFPFHLFHYRRGVESNAQIAVTPRPLSGDDDPTTRVLLTSIGEWSRQLVVGAPVEYVGNREYEVGMPVRRWDFASWARLGRPIVREYQSPSIQSVTLVVDTSREDRTAAASSARRRPSSAARAERDEAVFERLMSIAATAISEVSSRRVRLQLYVTSESVGEWGSPERQARQSEGSEPLLVRLAAAHPVDPELGQQRIMDLIESASRQPVLILSLLSLDDPARAGLAGQLPPSATYLDVGQSARQTEEASRS